jgi:SagB-type dehydrogenase family enzyme
MREQFVVENGERIPLWRWYHARSSHSRTGVIARGPKLDTSRIPAPFETYRSIAIVELPRDREPVDMPAGKAIDAANLATRALGDADVSLRRLSTLLHLAQGITSVTGGPGGEFHRRAAPSGGALYPIVTHVAVGDVDGLEPGIYHYEPKSHALHRIRAGDPRAELAAAVAHPQHVARAPFALVLSAYYYKTSRKYGERGYRYALLDGGHVAVNAAIGGAALDLAHAMIGRFDDAKLDALIGVDSDQQGTLLVMPFGAPADHVAATEPVFDTADLALASTEVPASVMLVASRTALQITDRSAPPYAPVAPPSLAIHGTRFELPEIAGDGDALGPVIERRRSQRRFADGALSVAQLSAVLRRAIGSSVEDQHAIRIHVSVNAVSGLAPGVYEYLPGEQTLRPIRNEEVASTIHGIALSQEVAAGAAAILMISAHAPTMVWPDGSRGYRYAWMDAGIAAGRVYVQGVGLGLGVSSIGAFFDEEAASFLGLDPAIQPVTLLVAVGIPG